MNPCYLLYYRRRPTALRRSVYLLQRTRLQCCPHLLISLTGYYRFQSRVMVMERFLVLRVLTGSRRHRRG